MRYRVPGFSERTVLFMAAFLLLSALGFSEPRQFAADEPPKGAANTALPDSQVEAKGVDPSTRASVHNSYGSLPLSFEVNRGQADNAVKYLSRGKGYTLFLTSTEAVLSLRRGSPMGRQSIAGNRREANESQGIADDVVRLKLLGSNTDPKITGLDELPGKSNYLVGNNPAKWQRDLPNYVKIRVDDVYEGIDLLYYGNQRQLEFDWIVASGADPKVIRFSVDGKSSLKIDARGDLIMDEKRDLCLRRPLIYQQRNGARTEIAGGYILLGKRRVGIQVGTYDTSLPLVIDPAISYSTYLGGSNEDAGYGIAVDSLGNAYVTGTTASSNFPTANPAQAANGGGTYDAFVAKLNASGSALVYSTYLGGGGLDEGFGIAVDSMGNAYVTGHTSSTDLPTVNPYQAAYGGGTSDAFVAKLNSSGNGLYYSTYLGGSGDYEDGNGIAVDSSGNAYVTGRTYSVNFPTANPYQAVYGGGGDAFVAKMSASGNELDYSTYLGGRAYEEGNAIAVDSSGNAYVTGFTSSTNFPTKNPYQAVSAGNDDVFITKLDASGNTLAYSTYFGGSNWEIGYGIAVDSSGNAYVAGRTTSTNLPTVNPYQAANGGYYDVFVSKLDASGKGPLYSTYLGGRYNDEAQGIAVNSSGEAYVTGYTYSAEFPTVDPFQAAINGTGLVGRMDAFVTKLDASGNSLALSSYLGGAYEDWGSGIALDAYGNAYVTGLTGSTNFPTAYAYQASKAGADKVYDAFITRISQYSCKAGAETLCLGGSRFSAEVEWNTPTGASGKGQAVPMTIESGYYWFFAAGNVELFVKLLDSRAVNGHFWFFWAALTDVQYTITVRDHETGAVKTYHGVQGVQTSGNDIYAF